MFSSRFILGAFLVSALTPLSAFALNLDPYPVSVQDVRDVNAAFNPDPYIIRELIARKRDRDRLNAHGVPTPLMAVEPVQTPKSNLGR